MGEINLPATEQSSFNAEKQALLADIAKKISALDNPVKLNILSLLIERGSMSITDVAKKLNINFSTAHKYLEQLEAAGLVKSKQVSENRLKRIFTVQNFNIELNPKSLFQKSTESNNKHKAKFKMFNNKGELVDFDEELFSQKYIKRGMPRGTVLLALQEILPQVYDGITQLELRWLFRQALEAKSKNIATVLEQIDKDMNHKRTFHHLLSVVHPEALKMHANGTIFIKNLRKPILMNFIHDVKSLLVHGVTGTAPANYKELLEQLVVAIASTNFVEGTQTLACFSEVLAKFPKTSDTILENFFEMLAQTGKRFLIEIDIGQAKDAKISREEIKGATGQLLRLFVKKKYANIIPVFKVWGKNVLPKEVEMLKEFYVVNTNSDVSVTEHMVLSEEWRGTFRLQRTGEIQELAINLLKIAKEAKSKGDFSKRILDVVKFCIEFHLNMMELSMGEFFRKYNIRRPSATQGHWSYAIPSNFVYSINLVNLCEAAKLMNLQEKELVRLMQDITKLMKLREGTLIRLLLKENADRVIVERFTKLANGPSEAKRPQPCPKSIVKMFSGGVFREMSIEEYKNLNLKQNKLVGEVLHVFG